MNASMFLGWAATFLATLFVFHKWAQRRERNRRLARGLRAYATGAELE